MQRLIYIVLLVCFSVSAFAQEETIYFGGEGIFEDSDTSLLYDKAPFKKNDRWSARFSTGASFNSMYGNGLFTSYAAPEINYKVTKDFSLSVGTMMTVSSLPSFMQWQESNTSGSNNRMVSYYMFAKGEYMVTDNLRVKASAVFDAGPTTSQNRFAYSNVGFDYKIGENTYISAEINFRNMNPQNPMFYNPVESYYNNSYIRPFGSTMFSDPFTTW